MCLRVIIGFPLLRWAFHGPRSIKPLHWQSNSLSSAPILIYIRLKLETRGQLKVLSLSTECMCKSYNQRLWTLLPAPLLLLAFHSLHLGPSFLIWHQLGALSFCRYLFHLGHVWASQLNLTPKNCFVGEGSLGLTESSFSGHAIDWPGPECKKSHYQGHPVT